MARAKNTVDTVQVTLSTTETIRRYLELMAETGFWGKNPAEAANQLISTGIRDLIKGGELPATLPPLAEASTGDGGDA